MYFFQIPNDPKCNKSFVNFALVMMRSFAFIFHSFSFLNILLCLKWWRSQTTNHLAWLAVPSWCQTQLFLFSQDPSLPRNLKWCVQAPAKNTRAFTAAWTQWKRWSLWSVLALCPLEAENNLRLGCFHPSSPFDKASATLTCLLFFGGGGEGGSCIIHMHQSLYYLWVMIPLFIRQLINLLFIGQACLLSPAESGGHGGEPGVRAGCSAPGRPGPQVAPSFGQRGKDDRGYLRRSWGKKSLLKWPKVCMSFVRRMSSEMFVLAQQNGL